MTINTLPALIHGHRADELHDRLLARGEPRDIQTIDNAIQSACEEYADTEGHRPDLDHTPTWWWIEGRALDYMDIDPEGE